jgi:putative protein-disulfide isomerase
MTRVAEEYNTSVDIEVLSGGMILPEKPVHIKATAGYISKAYVTVEKATGIVFGRDYLWHIENPDESDWYPNSEKPGIALCILKEKMPDKQVAMAAALQYALHFEGRDLTDDEAYRAILEDFKLDATEFYRDLHSDAYKQQAYEEFRLVKQLQVTGYPTVLLQAEESKFYLIARGFTNFEQMRERIDEVLLTLTSKYL